MAPLSALATCSWPTSSSNACGRYRRATTTYSPSECSAFGAGDDSFMQEGVFAVRSSALIRLTGGPRPPGGANPDAPRHRGRRREAPTQRDANLWLLRFRPDQV